MENIKVSVKHNDWSEVFDMLVELGAKQLTVKSNYGDKNGWLFVHEDIVWTGLLPHNEKECREVTFSELKDMVVLNRNDVNDRNVVDPEYTAILYLDSKGELFVFHVPTQTWKISNLNGEGEVMQRLKPIEEHEMKEFLVENDFVESIWERNESENMKEFLVNYDNKWVLRLLDSDTEENSYRVAVPEGATHYSEGRYSGNGVFLKVDGINQYEYYNDVWLLRCNPLNEMYFTTRLLWKRNPETPNTSIQDKLKFIEKWLNGEKIQYILGNESEKSQSDKYRWHNFTEGAMQYIKRSDIKFREAPKYVTINGIEFKSVESLLKHVKNNFDLEDEE